LNLINSCKWKNKRALTRFDARDINISAALASVTCVRYFQKRALTRFDARDIFWLFRLPDLFA